MRKILITIFALVIVVAALPLVAAFEANSINITSFVKQPIFTAKAFEAAPRTQDVDHDGDLDCDGVPDLVINGDPERPLGQDGLDDDMIDNVDELGNSTPTIGHDYCDELPAEPFRSEPRLVRVGERSCWNVNISVGNDTGQIMWQVVLTDRFSAEQMQPELLLAGVPVEIVEMNQNKGKGKGTRSSAAIEITWWVDYNEDADLAFPDDALAFDPLNEGAIDDDDGNFRTLAPGAIGLGIDEVAELTMLVCTGLNPSGRQEYTSPGCYNFNSGLTVKWLVGVPDPKNPELELHQMSFDGNRLAVLAIDEGDTASAQDITDCQVLVDADEAPD